jgi:arabinose-5-phosphate isomerase
VRDVMRSGDAVPKVLADVKLTDALLEITQKGMGMTAIVDGDNRRSACSPTATCAA